MYPIIQETEHYTITEQRFPMSDGVKLYTRITIPKCAKKCPTVFIRTPYTPASNGVPAPIDPNLELPYIRSGYGVVLQHCRGTGDSEGTCIPYEERSDGLDTLALIRNLPFYNGEIYLVGQSYLSTVHLLYMDTAPADIKGAALAIQTDRMYFRNYRGGCCYDFCNFSWWLRMMRRQFPNPKLDNALVRPYKDIMQRAVGEDVPAYTACLLNDTYTDFWKNDPRTHLMENWKIPLLLTEGWYDFYSDGMFSMWERLPEDTKAKSAFVVGPWGHATKIAKNCPYPLPDGDIPADFAVQWFNSIRQNKPYPYAETGKVNYYSIGGGKWDVSDFPQPAAGTKKLYFRKDHVLSDTACDRDERIAYVYDPEVRPGCFRHHGIFKAHAPNSVPGVISFLSVPVAEEQSFYGPIHWHMDVSSDCEDTAFFIRVYLMEDGESYNLTDTITSLSHLQPNYRPNDILTLDINTPPIGFTLKKGSSIRVDIASHSDIYVPHANVKGHWAEVTETKIANNTLHLKDAYIALPIE